MDRTSSRQPSNEAFHRSSFLYGGNASYIEDLAAQCEADPGSVPGDWRAYFAGLNDNTAGMHHATPGASWRRSDWPQPQRDDLTAALDGNWGAVERTIGKRLEQKATVAGAAVSEADMLRATRDSVRAIMMIRAYRVRGHLHANLDPLGIEPPQDHGELHPSSYGFTEADWDRPIFIDNVLGMEFATIRQMLDVLRRTSCATIGYEFTHISDPTQKQWLQERIEAPHGIAAFSAEQKKGILEKLIEVKGYERYLDKKFVGTKRFGLDGAEATIPALEEIIRRASELGVVEVVLGMAHRGRLNVLSQVMKKPHRAIFNEFKGGSFLPDEVEGSGDVKYHLGASSDRDFDGRTVHLSLTANPSHLEISDPVVLGKVRAKQDQHGDTEERITILPLLIHGDAVLAGQGVVAGPGRVATLCAVVVLVSFGILQLGQWSIVALVIGVAIMDAGAQGSLVSNQTRSFALNPMAQNRINTLYTSSMFLGGACGSALSTNMWVWAGWTGVVALCAVLSALACLVLLRRGPN